MCQERDGSQIREDLRFSVGADGIHDTLFEDTIPFDGRLFDARDSLQKWSPLLPAVAFKAGKELPHRWVIALEQRRKTVMPSFDAVRRASDPVGGGVALIPCFNREERRSKVLATTSKTTASDVRVLEVSDEFIHVIQVWWLLALIPMSDHPMSDHPYERPSYERSSLWAMVLWAMILWAIVPMSEDPMSDRRMSDRPMGDRPDTV